MKNVNLIPAPRRDAKRRRKHHKACAIACGTYGALLACAVGGAHLMYGAGAENLDDRLVATDNEITRLERQADETRSELASSRATVEANRSVAEQPDWSVLLAMLATTTGNDVVLRSVNVAPPPPTAGAPAQNPAANAAGKSGPDALLEVTGIGRSQLAVSQHVLRLEQTGLFAKVTLLDTGREPFLNANSIGFRIQCVFGERQQESGSKQPAAAPGGTITAAETGGINQ